MFTIDADLPKGAGLSMGLAAGPEPYDEVVTSDGAHVFLSRPAALRLGRRTLRAEIGERRSVFFLDR